MRINVTDAPDEPPVAVAGLQTVINLPLMITEPQATRVVDCIHDVVESRLRTGEPGQSEAAA